MASKPLYYTVTESLVGADFEYLKGEVVDADDPAVRKWPSHFGPLVVRGHTGGVEQATAAPGEKRHLSTEPAPEPVQVYEGKAMTNSAMKGRG